MPYALGGARLEGARLVRQAFCDESYSRRGPWFVVAGPVVHADTQLVPIETHLEELAAKHIPEADRKGFVFHAADIWNNNGYFKDRTVWPRDRCWDILADLAAIPRKFEVPIAIGLKRKDQVKQAVATHAAALEERAARTLHDVATHGIAFVDYTHIVERTMRTLWEDEVAELVAENRKEVEESLMGVHYMLKTDPRIEEWKVKPTQFPLTHIRGGIKFAAKRDEPLLQVADLCAYVTLAVLEGSHDHAPFYNAIYSMLLAQPKGQSWPPLEWPDGPLVPLWKESPEERDSELGRLRRLLRAQRRRLRDAGEGNVE